jgi:hypothetical protein
VYFRPASHVCAALLTAVSLIGAANPNALYLISSGGNDIAGAICLGGVCAGNVTQLAQTSAAALAAAIAQLHAVPLRATWPAIHRRVAAIEAENYLHLVPTRRVFDR